MKISSKILTGIRAILDARGYTQAWVINRMNDIDPSLEMNRSKLSAVVCGSRKITGDELLAFCMATETSPDYFLHGGETVKRVNGFNSFWKEVSRLGENKKKAAVPAPEAQEQRENDGNKEPVTLGPGMLFACDDSGMIPENQPRSIPEIREEMQSILRKHLKAETELHMLMHELLVALSKS